ncbi:beta-lactamase/transpeptidase-like protein [Lipomyces starkeyi]
MGLQLDSESVDMIKSLIENATADQKRDIPGVYACVASKDGDVLLSHAAGKAGVNSDEPMTPETVFWIASCTKLVVAIAAMQLVEQGLMSLDDPARLEEICPELKNVPLIKEVTAIGGLLLVPKKNRMTLRQLLTHTAGFGHTFNDQAVRIWGEMFSIDKYGGDAADVLQPLKFEPGTGWMYGAGYEWVGKSITRVSGLKLNDYITQNILEPLGITDVSIIPTGNMKKHLVKMSYRLPDGTVIGIDHYLKDSLSDDASALRPVYHSAGAGLFAAPAEYCKILMAIANDGACAIRGTRILEKESVDEMFKNQVPDIPYFGATNFVSVRHELSNQVEELFPQSGKPQGWGITGRLNLHDTDQGRSAGSTSWAGLANLYWWVDRETGIVGFVCAQLIPFLDAKVLKLWMDVEEAVYKGLIK